jgi:hypothetical protein
MPIDYSKGKIYKIESLSTGLVYIGSTCQPLSVRLGGHSRDFKQYKNGTKHFTTSFKVLECDDYKILLIEDYPCDRKEQLLAREGEWIRKIDCVNKIIPGRTDKQYRRDNDDKIKEYGKQWRQDNANKINAKNNCDCGGYFTYAHKSQHINTIQHQHFLGLQSSPLHQMSPQINDPE